MSPTELRALKRFQGGDQAAFQDLMHAQLGPLTAFARRALGSAEVEDLLQETLIRAHRGLREFRGNAALRTWLFSIMMRLIADFTRKHKRITTPLEDVAVPSYMADPLDDLQERELRERLAEAVERLAPRQRAAFHLRAVEGYGYKRIAEIMACSLPAARMLVLEARKRVMARLGRHLEP